jgi:hypothetical protein
MSDFEHKDFRGTVLSVGDRVVVAEQGYRNRHLVGGTVIGFTKCFVIWSKAGEPTSEDFKGYKAHGGNMVKDGGVRK